MYAKQDDFSETKDMVYSFSALAIKFCEYHRAFIKGKKLDYDVPEMFVKSFESSYPLLAEQWERVDDSIDIGLRYKNIEKNHKYGLRIINLAVKGLHDDTDTAIFEKYYCRCYTIKDLAASLYRSTKQTSRRIKLFGEKVTSQLMIINEHVAENDTNIVPCTYEQLMINKVMDKYTGLSPAIAATLWFYTTNRRFHKGREKAAENFGIGMDALKKRHRKIIRFFHCKRVNDAVKIVVNDFHLDDTNTD